MFFLYKWYFKWDARVIQSIYPFLRAGCWVTPRCNGFGAASVNMG
jgi:hypothetical protein